MGAARMMDQSDFDLERFIGMFDEALTSKDPRVIDALRSLMMMVILTKPETNGPAVDRQQGPLRRLYTDVNNLARRLNSLEEEVQRYIKLGQRADDGRRYQWKDEYSFNEDAILKQMMKSTLSYKDPTIK